MRERRDAMRREVSRVRTCSSISLRMPGGGGEAGRERKEGMETVRREWAEERGKREEVEGGRGEGGREREARQCPK